MSSTEAPPPSSSSSTTTTEEKQTTTTTPDHDLQALTKEAENTSLKLQSITDGCNVHGVPKVKFVEDITAFANTFDPPASAELMIGAYSDLFGNFKKYEGSLVQKSECSGKERKGLNAALYSYLITHCYLRCVPYSV